MRLSERFARAVFRQIKERGWNQSEFADKIGETRFWVSKLLRNQLKNVSEDQVFKIEELLGIDIYGSKDEGSTSDPVAIALSKEINQRSGSIELFETMVEVLRGDRLYELPTLYAHDRHTLGRLIVTLSEKAKEEPIEAAGDLLEKLSGLMQEMKEADGGGFSRY